MIKINGKSESGIAGKTIYEYLKTTPYDLNRIVVELNGNIVPKLQYSKTVLQSGDCVEIVRFVGGG